MLDGGSDSLRKQIFVADHSVGELILRLKATQEFRDFVLDKRLHQYLINRRPVQGIHLQTSVHKLFHFGAVALRDWRVVAHTDFFAEHNNISCVDRRSLTAHLS